MSTDKYIRQFVTYWPGGPQDIAESLSPSTRSFARFATTPQRLICCGRNHFHAPYLTLVPSPQSLPRSRGTDIEIANPNPRHLTISTVSRKSLHSLRNSAPITSLYFVNDPRSLLSFCPSVLGIGRLLHPPADSVFERRTVASGGSHLKSDPLRVLTSRSGSLPRIGPVVFKISRNRCSH